jgi:hypothetical protein
MSPECKTCGSDIAESIRNFDVESAMGDHEQLSLLQCEKCRGFQVTVCGDDFMSGNTYWYDVGSFTPEEAELIFLFFMSCNDYKKCKCEIHQAIYAWLGGSGTRTPLEEQATLVERIKAKPEYAEWKEKWAKATLPQSGNA